MKITDAFGRIFGESRPTGGTILKALDTRFEEISKMIGGSEEQGALVSDNFEWIDRYEVQPGVREKEGVNFAYLRWLSYAVEPVTAIIERRVQNVSAFGRRVDARRGRVQEPGYRVRLSDPNEEANEDDARIINEIEVFIQETGYCEPPEDEKPETYRRGFENYLSQITRDSLVLDWVVTRTWKSERMPDQAPVVSFCAEDSALFRRTSNKILSLQNGVPKLEKYHGLRNNTDRPIQFVMFSDASASQVIAEFTKDEAFSWVRNAITDIKMRGYGYPELERCMIPAIIWIYARNYNAQRFKKGGVPKGFLKVVGNMDEKQFMQFRTQWKQMMEGADKAWNIPVIRFLPMQGADLQWTPIDPSNRDMEYHQFMFMVSIWIHSIFQIHPEETGYETLSPFKPPLSQASPEVKLKYSQDSGLTPLLKRIEDMINRNIIWRNYPSRRYRMEFVGMGDYDEMQDVQTRAARLQSGLSTPRMEWAELDQKIPDAMKDHPAWDMPMPFGMGLQYQSQLEQSKAAEQASGGAPPGGAEQNPLAALAALGGGEQGAQGSQPDETIPRENESEPNPSLNIGKSLLKSIIR